MRSTLMSIALCAVVLPNAAFAVPQFTAPNSTTVAACPDYATETFNDSWDFSNSEDVPRALKPRQYQNISEPAFSNGLLSFTATSSDPYFSLVTVDDFNAAIPVPLSQRFGVNGPIDVSRYRRVTFRMKTNVASNYQILWTGVASGNSFAITNPLATFAGAYHVYSLDLGAAGLNQQGSGLTSWLSDNKRLFRIDPGANSGAAFDVDWAMLTPDDENCAQITSTYSETAGQAALTVIDDNTDFADGVHNYSVAATTGTAQNASFPVARLFPGTYQVYGYSSPDYASLFSDPWDFNQSTDVEQVNSIPNAIVAGSAFSGTTGSSANFYLKVDADKPIDTSIFKRLTVRMNVSNPTNSVGLAYIYWFDQSGALKGSTESAPMQVNPGDNTLTWDLSQYAGWTGSVYDLRIDPDIRAGVSFSISSVNLSTGSILPTDSVAAVQSTASVATVSTPKTVEVVQPDDHGGRDCPTHDFGNPWVMDSTSDIVQSSNVVTPQIFPYNRVTDGRGLNRVGDFYAGTTGSASTPGFDDPKLFPVLFNQTINADRCIHTCYSMMFVESPEIFHSVARLTYQAVGVNQDGDDIVNPDSWESSDICVQMNTLKQEPDIAPGAVHPWKGSIDFFSFDPVEETADKKFYVDYIELRENHKSNTGFAVTIDADTTTTVDLYVSTTAPTSARSLPNGASKIGSLAAARNTNVFTWATAGVANGTYYVSAMSDPAGLNPLVSHGLLPVVVDHGSTQDAAAPTLIVDSPAAGDQATNSVQIAGAAFDDVRINVVEVLIDNVLYASFKPDLHHKQTREQFAAVAHNNPGFNRFVDISALAGGAHTLTYKVTDTAGNVTTRDIAFTKGGSSTPQVTYADPNGAPIDFTAVSNSMTLNVNDGKNVSFTLVGYDTCVSTTLEGSRTSDFSTLSPMIVKRGGGTLTAADVPQFFRASAITSDGFQTLAAKKKKKLTPRQKCLKIKNKKKRKTCLNKLKPVPTPAPTPIAEDGLLYFRAICQENMATVSNTVELNAKSALNNPGNTSEFETLILQAIQTKLNS